MSKFGDDPKHTWNKQLRTDAIENNSYKKFSKYTEKYFAIYSCPFFGKEHIVETQFNGHCKGKQLY